jgi:aspartyl-tRNA(Asn)/glutamyl-tRNA(Gln) amidotransferase subunit A
MSRELVWWTAVELADAIRSKRVSSVEALDAVLAQVERVNPRTNAIVTLAAGAAREQALAADRAVARGDTLGALHGVPITVKDLEETAGIRTTFGSKLFEQHVPAHDHPMVERLRRAGAVIVGKTNTSEFGLIPITTNALFGPSSNPWDPARNTGGSSGGAAAAVACGMGPLATGSDGGGSIRVPAAWNGVFGLKPHHGRIPDPHFPPGWESLSAVGPLARSVRDAARMLDVASGPHASDRWSLPDTGARFEAACTGEARGLRLAWSPDLGGMPVERAVREACTEALDRLEKLGCAVEEVRLELPPLFPALSAIVLCEQATAWESRRAEWDAVMTPVLRGFLPAADALGYRDLVRAGWAREELWAKLAPVFERHDALLTPQMPITAPLQDTLGPAEVDGRPIEPLGWLGFCFPFNLTGQPAASLPIGFAPDGLPVALQLVGRRFDEATLLRLASAYEAAYPWSGLRPPLAC